MDMLMDVKSTRAQKMAEQYGKKLQELNVIDQSPKQLKHTENETPEMIAKRKVALEKLASFKDMIG